MDRVIRIVRFAVDKFGIEVFGDRLIAVDEFHHVSANPDHKLGDHIRQLMAQDKTHIIAMTGSYGEGGYNPGACNIGVHPERGQIQIEIKGLAEPKSPEAERICREDLTALITAFVQDKPTIERGLFNEELVPEELTQVRMGKIIKEKFPTLEEEDQEAIRQHAIAALNLVQQAKYTVNEAGGTYAVPSSPVLSPSPALATVCTQVRISWILRINREEDGDGQPDFKLYFCGE